MPVRDGQTYTACDPRDSIRIRIVAYTPGHDHARVADAATGKRPRWIQVRALHASATRADGQPRRTGYALDTTETP